MTLYEFNVLNEDEKTALLWSEGLFVTDKPGSSILLYQLYDFYVEVFYEGKENKIQRLRSFSSLDQLDAYLNIVDISSVTDLL